MGDSRNSRIADGATTQPPTAASHLKMMVETRPNGRRQRPEQLLHTVSRPEGRPKKQPHLHTLETPATSIAATAAATATAAVVRLSPAGATQTDHPSSLGTRDLPQHLQHRHHRQSPEEQLLVDMDDSTEIRRSTLTSK
ncbi:hypothetical protein EDD11_009349, partial [Mortierella claussenii]